jgi:hypothetical protein
LTYLLQQQLPVDADCRFLVFPAVLTQSAGDVAHALEAVSSVQQVLDVLGHDLCDVLELIVELVEVLGGARVLVCLFCALDERVELDELVGAARGREVLLGLVDGCELAREIRQVGKCQLAGVGAVADAEEAEVAADEVAVGGVLAAWGQVADTEARRGVLVRVGAALDAGLGLRVAVQPALDELDL